MAALTELDWQLGQSGDVAQFAQQCVDLGAWPGDEEVDPFGTQQDRAFQSGRFALGEQPIA